MGEAVKIEIEAVFVSEIRMKSTQRDCPRCEAVLFQNEPEQCYECLNCGYIDCGNDD